MSRRSQFDRPLQLSVGLIFREVWVSCFDSQSMSWPAPSEHDASSCFGSPKPFFFIEDTANPVYRNECTTVITVLRTSATSCGLAHMRSELHCQRSYCLKQGINHWTFTGFEGKSRGNGQTEGRKGPPKGRTGSCHSFSGAA